MKKVRLLNFLFLWLIAGILFSGCSDEEDPVPTLVGYWELSDDQTTLTLEYPSDDVEYEVTFDFNEMILTEETNSGATIIYRYTKEY